ncbi:MAG: hypothetical protein ACT452_17005 [Microthrixaceae bacterium]
MRRRLGPPLLGMGAVTVFMALVSGGSGVVFGMAGMFLIAGVVWMIASWIERRRPSRQGGWASDAAVAFHPAAAHSAASPWSVSVSLGRVEARELLSSASMGVGLGFCLMVLVLFGRVWAGDYQGDVLGAIELYPIYVHPLAGLVVLAAHRARTRSRRDGTEELFGTCPTSQGTRTLGHLLPAGAAASVALTFLALMTLFITANTLGGISDIGARQVAAVLGAALLCVGATALGVMLGRWAPWTLVPVAVVIAIGFGSTRLATAGNRQTEPIRQLSTWLNDPAELVRFTAPPWLAHHLWILALVGLVAVVALLRDDRRPQVLLAGAAFAVLAVVSAIAATRPIDTADAEHIASLINEPEAHQRCVDVGELPVCAYGSDRELTEHIAETITPVVLAAPRGSLAGWSVRQDTSLDRAELDPEVRRLLTAEPNDRRYIPMDKVVQRSAADEGARFWVALTAVGVTADITEGAVLSIDHQARGVIALWLATRGVDAETAAAMTSTDDATHDSGNYVSDFGHPWPDRCYAGPAPVTWALSDLDAARQLLALPEPAVRDLLRSDWDHLIDRDTSTDELLVALGFEPVPPRAGSTVGGGEC